MSNGRGSIGADATLRVWVLAGGRCEYCNRYLLEDEVTGYPFNLAERAHIVGATTGARSPRGQDPLPLDERGEMDNLMLLCREHHRLIDTLIAEHSVEGLRRMKRLHEDRIRLLTGLKDEAETLVVRVIGGIRGAPVEIPRSAILRAVRADDRFPRFRLALAGEDIEIDLRQLPEEAASDYWSSGEKLIADRLGRVRDAQDSIHHISLFALTRTPFLIAVGFYLDDKIPTTVYGRQRTGTGDEGWGYDPEAEPMTFAVEQIASAEGDEVALAVSLTAPISDDVLEAVDGAYAVYEIAPEGRPHGRDLLESRASLEAFADTYHQFLAMVEDKHREARRLHIFTAAPAPAAVQIGRGIMRDAQPVLVVHERCADGRFQPVLTLGSRSPQP